MSRWPVTVKRSPFPSSPTTSTSITFVFQFFFTAHLDLLHTVLTGGCITFTSITPASSGFFDFLSEKEGRFLEAPYHPYSTLYTNEASEALDIHRKYYPNSASYRTTPRRRKAKVLSMQTPMRVRQDPLNLLRWQNPNALSRDAAFCVLYIPTVAALSIGTDALPRYQSCKYGQRTAGADRLCSVHPIFPHVCSVRPMGSHR